VSHMPVHVVGPHMCQVSAVTGICFKKAVAVHIEVSQQGSID